MSRVVPSSDGLGDRCPWMDAKSSFDSVQTRSLTLKSLDLGNHDAQEQPTELMLGMDKDLLPELPNLQTPRLSNVLITGDRKPVF